MSRDHMAARIQAAVGRETQDGLSRSDETQAVAPPSYRVVYLAAGFAGIIAGMAAFAWWWRG